MPFSFEPLAALMHDASWDVWATFGGVSVGMLVVSAVVTPFALARIPSDYFKHDKPHFLQRLRSVTLCGALALIAKNVAGLLLLIAGAIMLVTPGQGLLTALFGLILIDFPGKLRFERRLIRTPKVLDAINWCRHKAGRPPLDL